MTLRSDLRSSQTGATAIEYAIIAGLIGLGLVGSLVTTRGSLSAIFGTAGSQMASSTGADASAGAGAGSGSVTPAPTPPPAPKLPASNLASTYKGKTLLRIIDNPYQVQGGNTVLGHSYVFSDGSYVSYRPAYIDVNGNAMPDAVSLLDGTLDRYRSELVQGAYGSNPPLYQEDIRFADGTPGQGRIQQITAAVQITSGTTDASRWTYSTSGVLQGSSTVTVGYGLMAKALQDAAFFRSIQ